jgi:ABC-type Na+ efflux pump permease subunit
MTFLPIVERELRVAARRRATYGMRFRIAGAATLAFAACIVASEFSPSVPVGKTLYLGLSWLCMVYCLSAGRMMTADCLSREKREGTLGLLFLTDLKGYDVVLGKLAATSLDGFYALLAVFPLLAVPLLAGGMTNGELWRMTLVLVNTFLFSLAVGLFVSAACRDERKAMAANFGLILLLAAALPAFEGMRVMSAWPSRPVTPAFFYSCPVYSFLQSADVAYKTEPVHFWFSIVVTFDLTVVLVMLACRIAPVAWQDKPVSARSIKQKAKRRGRWWREGRWEKANAFREKLLNVNAYFWLAARPYLKVSYVWTCMLCMGIWWIATTLLVGHKDDAVNFGLAFLVNGMLKLWAITEAGHQLAADKKSGAFELLLCTPLTVTDIVHGQWLALRRQFLVPMVVAVIFELVLMVSTRHIQAQDDVIARAIWLAGIVMFLADMVTVGWVAMSGALTEKSHDRATLKTAALVLAMPWVLFAIVEAIGHLWHVMTYFSPWDPDWRFQLGWWFGLGLFVDLVLLLRARRRVRQNFRQLALDPPAPKSRFAWFHGWRTQNVERKTPLRAKLRRLAIPGVVLLVIGAAAIMYATRSFRSSLPAAVVISIGQSNRLAQVFPSQRGYLIILPDGSLWRWVHPRETPAKVAQPQPIGIDHDWLQASLMDAQAAAIRSDGTLWAWELRNEEPKQVGTNRDWEEVRAGNDFIIARKKDGTLWVRNNRPIFSIGHNTSPALARGLQQVGTRNDWKAISTAASSANLLALRNDGTLWTCGDFNYFKNGAWSHTNYPFPIQVCCESNWGGFGSGGWCSARNQTGEWWSFFPFRDLPGPNVAVASIGQLASSNAAMSALGPFFHDNWEWVNYELRPDGTMWVTPFNWPFIPSTPKLHFGQRSDWVSVWGGPGTMIGLTSDGTLWTWGLDFGQERHYDLGERVNLVRTAVSNAFNARQTYDEWGGNQPQKEPRPLLRVTMPNSVQGSP